MFGRIRNGLINYDDDDYDDDDYDDDDDDNDDDDDDDDDEDNQLCVWSNLSNLMSRLQSIP